MLRPAVSMPAPLFAALITRFDMLSRHYFYAMRRLRHFRHYATPRCRYFYA